MKQVKTISDLLASAISTETSRLILHGVLEESDENGVWRVATDTYRLVVIKMGEAKKERYKKIVYPEHVALALDPAKYPNWQKVMPGEQTKSATLPIEPLRRALKSVREIAKYDGQRVTIRFAAGHCTVSAFVSGAGDVTAMVDIDSAENMDGFSIAVNAEFLLETLPYAGRSKDYPKTIRLSCTESTRPIVVSYDHDGAWGTARVTIMPMALRDKAVKS